MQWRLVNHRNWNHCTLEQVVTVSSIVGNDGSLPTSHLTRRLGYLVRQNNSPIISRSLMLTYGNRIRIKYYTSCIACWICNIAEYATHQPFSVHFYLFLYCWSTLDLLHFYFCSLLHHWWSEFWQLSALFKFTYRRWSRDKRKMQPGQRMWASGWCTSTTEISIARGRVTQRGWSLQVRLPVCTWSSSKCKPQCTWRCWWQRGQVDNDTTSSSGYSSRQATIYIFERSIRPPTMEPTL